MMFPQPNSEFLWEDVWLSEKGSDPARAAAARARRRRHVLKRLGEIRDTAQRKMLDFIEQDTVMNRGQFVMSPRSKSQWKRAWDADAASMRIARMRVGDERPLIAVLKKKLRKATRRFF